MSLDESENTITFWHCGTAACSIAREDTGATIGVHPNRKIGPVMDFGCKAADKVTVFRVGQKQMEALDFLSQQEVLSTSLSSFAEHQL